ncbi:T9SS C-terminal target domain-containing protein [bacterium]|nr:T9SS C-terminal target domain-containing protein [bacterium]
MFRRLLIAFVLCLVPAIAFGQVSDNGKPVKTITDADIVGTVTFDSDTVYNLDGFVFVDSGEVLNIEAGTIIKANPGQAELASALIVSQGGLLNAIGTENAPIIFTSTSDDLDDPSDIPYGNAGRKLWGGVIMLGYATINTTAGVGNIEGLPPSARTQYGGSIDNDNSGTLQYVSIRHGGSVFGDADEINGLTLGGVGNGTTIDYLEIFQNFDDGVEWFGGTVRIKHAIVAFCGDDGFDIDEGWSGGVQFGMTIMDEEDGENSGEHDGGTTPENGTPFATPVFSNMTYLGAGANAATSANPRVFNIRDNCSPAYYNSIFSDHNGIGIIVEQSGSQPTDSEDRLLAGDLVFQNNAWGLFKSGYAPSVLAGGQSWTETLFTDASFQNRITDPGINVSRQPDGMNDPRPKNNTAKNLPSWTDPTQYNPPAKPNFGQTFAGFFEDVDYIGAFDPNANIGDLWVANWTAFDFYGFLGENDGGCGGITDNGKPVETVTDADIVGDVYWSSDTVWNLDGFVFVDSGETLTIEAGTIIKANPGQAELASALIVSQGGKLFANGTRECPIIFTSTSDDLDDPSDIPYGNAGRKLWGGVIMLGYATINTTAGVGNIEGLPPSVRTQYGGSIDNDNSGSLRFVSIRHGGSVFGDADEINGLTLGGVGNGTTIDYVEIFQNFDDGIEWFGGTVRIKHAVVAFCGDDGFDIDEGWSGGVQYGFTIMDEEDSENSGEHDGGTTPENGTPFATPVFSNMTYLGAGANAATSANPRVFNIRDNCSPAYYNSIFSDHNGIGIIVEQSGSQPTDSEDRLLAGDLVFRNNAWGVFTAGNTPSILAGGQSWTETLFTTGSFNNLIVDPQIYVTRAADQQNDPRPKATAGLPSWTDPTAYNPPAKPNFGQTFAGWFDEVDYVGGFDPNVSIEDNWMAGWTAFDTYGYLGENNGSSSCCVGNTGNVNADAGGTVDLSDLIYFVNYLFLGGPAPTCLSAANVNGDLSCTVDLSDLIYLVNYLFLGGPAPAACVAGC